MKAIEIVEYLDNLLDDIYEDDSSLLSERIQDKIIKAHPIIQERNKLFWFKRIKNER